MFHVVDHGKIIYSGELSQVTQFILDHYDKNIGKAIRSGVRVTYDNVVYSGIEQYGYLRTNTDHCAS